MYLNKALDFKASYLCGRLTGMNGQKYGKNLLDFIKIVRLPYF